MKHINEFLSKKDLKERSWCLWDYTTKDHLHEILVWKGDGKSPDQSDINEYDKNGKDLMNVEFSEVLKYCKEHKNDNVDKWQLDFSNANWDKIESIF